MVWLGLMLTPSSSSHGGLGTNMGTKDSSQALTEILRQVPGPCCGRVSTYNINIAFISKSAPSACSESEPLILVTRGFFIFLSPISLAELTQPRASEWDPNFGSHLTALPRAAQAIHVLPTARGSHGVHRDIFLVPGIA